jgi:hypothetical protein
VINDMSNSILTATGSKYEIHSYEIKNLDNFIFHIFHLVTFTSN